MSSMTTVEWVEKFQGEGVKVEFQTFDLAINDGWYCISGDEIAIDPRIHISTLFHELSHWTGHSSRLDRPLRDWRTQANAKEEVIAWISTTTIGERLGFELESISVEYFEKYTEIFEGPYPKTEALAASSFLIEHFSL